MQALPLEECIRASLLRLNKAYLRQLLPENYGDWLAPCCLCLKHVLYTPPVHVIVDATLLLLDPACICVLTCMTQFALTLLSPRCNCVLFEF